MSVTLGLDLRLLDNRANANAGTHTNFELRANGYCKKIEEDSEEMDDGDMHGAAEPLDPIGLR